MGASIDFGLGVVEGRRESWNIRHY